MLSKSKLLAFRQCPKRLWLEVHRPGIRLDLQAADTRFQVGHTVGEVARWLYDPKNKGVLVHLETIGTTAALERSTALLASAQPIFEAGFAANGGLVFSDIMLPVRRGGQLRWRMIEVKSTTSVKDYHSDEVAIQVYVAKASGVPLSSIAVAHIDSSWSYPGENNYQGLLVEQDVLDEADARATEVEQWIADAGATVSKTSQPVQGTGRHCSVPFQCGFLDYCRQQEPKAEISFEVLPNISKSIRAYVAEHGIIELEDIPNSLLNGRQRRVKKHALSGTTYFDKKGAAKALAPHKLPATFLDFETIAFAVPVWKGTRPYQQIPFQFSAHRLSRTGVLTHEGFLQLDGADPSKGCAQALIEACGARGPIFAYNAGFEMARINELATRFPSLKQRLKGIAARLVDLMPIAREYFYHPTQQGSWSLKSVLPALIPELDYARLDGVQNGGMAMAAFLEAIALTTSAERKGLLQKQLLEYCQLDTYALVRLWQVLSGRSELTL